MDKQKKKLLFVIGGAVLAAALCALILILALGGGSSSYEQHYAAAESAFLAQDYSTALKELDKAMAEQPTEEAYLLMADIYYAQGDRDMAIQVLYLGFSRVGGSAISNMLEALKAEQLASPAAPEGVTVAGETFSFGTSSVVLKNSGLTNADLTELATLSALESLSVAGNEISSVASLSSLASLTTLDLSDNKIVDLSALSSLASLKTLYLDGNPITDFSPLCSLSSLCTLSMKRIGITQSQLNALQQALPECHIYAEAPVQERTEITLGGKTFDSTVTELNLAALDLDDISALAQCTALTKLDLRDNHIADLSPLAALEALEWLCLWNNEVEDISPLAALHSLRYLDLDSNAIADCSPLAGLPALEELWLSNNPLADPAPLTALQGLTRLGLKNTGLTDTSLEALAALRALTELSIEENPALGRAAYEALASALPECTIAHSDFAASEDPGPADTPAPEYPGALDSIYVSIGKDAAVNVSGTGSGYGILWGAADQISASVHQGFVSQAEELSLNLVCDLWSLDPAAELDSLLSRAQTAGADVLIVSVDDDTLAPLLAAAEALSYTPRFLQIY